MQVSAARVGGCRWMRRVSGLRGQLRDRADGVRWFDLSGVGVGIRRAACVVLWEMPEDSSCET